MRLFYSRRAALTGHSSKNSRGRCNIQVKRKKLGAGTPSLEFQHVTLPAAAMEAATTVESASATIPTITVEALATAETVSATVLIPAVEFTVGVSAIVGMIVAVIVPAGVSMRVVAASVTPSIAIPPAVSIAPSPAAAIISTIPEPRRVSPVIPGTSADKHAVDKIIRPVVAVRRASIWIKVVISVGAHGWSGSNVARTNANTNSDGNLRLRIR